MAKSPHSSEDSAQFQGTRSVVPSLRRACRPFRSSSDNPRGGERPVPLSSDVYEAILRTMEQGVLLVDRNDRVVFTNHRATEILARRESELMGHNVRDFLADEELASSWSEAREQCIRGQTLRADTLLLTAKGGAHVRLVRAALTPNGGKVSSAVLICLLTDLTDLRVAHADVLVQNHRLARLAATDDLTGLVNRRRFNELLGEAWMRWRRTGSALSCIMLDLDHFKGVNDRYGHPAGDEALRTTAETIHSTIDRFGVAARYGGEEFAILLPNIDGTSAYVRAEHLREAIAGLRLSLGKSSVRLTASLGVATATTKLSGPGELVCRADLALYDAKRRGRNRTSLWNLPSAAEILEQAGTDGWGSVSTEQALGDDRWVGRAMGSNEAMVMARAIAEKDQPTGSHCMWVGWLASQIARRMGMGAEQTETLHIAGILHDLGKIGIPEAILLKPGPLTEQERELIDCHAQIGAEIVARHKGDRRIQTAIRYHHDWFDGTKGISGLKGSRLPRSARILAVADSFQSMIEDRPYRSSLRPEQAVAELRRCSGTQFDPAIVEVLADIMTATPEPVLEAVM